MRILYVLASSGLKADSVQTKVMTQIQCLNKAGASCKGAFFSTEVTALTTLNDNIDLIPVEKTGKQWFNKIRQRKINGQTIAAYLNVNSKSYDCIYIRYPGADKAFYRIVKKWGHKILIEFQGKNIDEIKTYKRDNPFTFRPSVILSYWQYYFHPLLNEWYYRKKIVKHLSAVVGITDEISRYYNPDNTKSYTLGNGIEVSSYKMRNAPSESDTIRLLFLAGTAGASAWNGVDRIIAGIQNYKGTHTLKLIIGGNHYEHFPAQYPFVETPGYLSKKQTDALADTCHLGIGTLSLHRKGLNEAAALKVREYFARGLPVVIGYSDTDIEQHPEMKAYAYRIPNDESVPDMEGIIAFAKGMMQNQSHPQTMRQLASAHLSWEVKMKDLLEFIQQAI